MKKIVVCFALLSSAILQAQMGKPFTIGGIQQLQIIGISYVEVPPITIEDFLLDAVINFPGVFTVDGIRLQKIDYKEQWLLNTGYVTRVFRAADGRTDTLRLVRKTETEDEHAYMNSDRTIYNYSEDGKLLSYIQYAPDLMPDSLGSYCEFYFEYDDLGRVSNWQKNTYRMMQDWSLLNEESGAKRNGPHEIVEGLPVWKGIQLSVRTVYDYEANLIAISREGIAKAGLPAWNDTIRLRPTENGYIAEKKSYDPGGSTPFPPAWVSGAEIRYILDHQGRLLHVMDEQTGVGIAYTYLEDGYDMEMTVDRSLTCDGSDKAMFRFYENGYVSGIRYQNNRKTIDDKYEYLAFDNTLLSQISPIPSLPASSQEILTAVPGGLHLRLAAPTSVEIFLPNGRLLLRRTLCGETTLPLSPALYLIRTTPSAPSPHHLTRRILIH